jgi:hypothetical protein
MTNFDWMGARISDRPVKHTRELFRGVCTARRDSESSAEFNELEALILGARKLGIEDLVPGPAARTSAACQPAAHQ